MTASIFDGCGEGCGWSAAILAALAWGTFGVPLKTNVNVEVNFFVMQTYKNMVCFATSWLIVFLGEPVVFTPWGIVSGLFWVPGAACGIYAIRQAGLAISVGTWSSIQLCTSFLFGIVIFEESVRSILSTVFAFCFLMMGLVGMSRYADPSQQPQQAQSASSATSGSYEKVHLQSNADTSIATNDTLATSPASVEEDLSLHDSTSSTTNLPSDALSVKPTGGRLRKTSKTGASGASNGLHMSASSSVPGVPHAEDGNGVVPAPFSGGVSSPAGGTNLMPMEMEMTPVGGSGDTSDNSDASLPLLNNQHAIGESQAEVDEKLRRSGLKRGFVVLFGGRLVLTKRQTGIMGAVVNGAWGGLNLIPLHYAHRDQGIKGATYLISYATGSMIVCICIWIGMFCYQVFQSSKKPQFQRHQQLHQSTAVPAMATATTTITQLQSTSADGDSIFYDAFKALPSWHVRQLGIPGLMAGLFYSVGNFCSILAVAYLGQGVGFSVCQAQLLISGLWGVFYFHEIQGREVVTKWFISACVTVAGIIWLSYEHVGGEGGH